MKRLLLVIITAILTSGSAPADEGSNISAAIASSFRARAAGDFRTAYHEAERLYMNGDDEQRKMALYLIDEITCIPDVVPMALSSLERIGSERATEDVQRLYDVISMSMHARGGSYHRAESLCDKLGFVRNIEVSHPIHVEKGESIETIRSVCEVRNPGETLIDKFNMKSDRNGVFGFDAFYTQTGKKAFKAIAKIIVPDDGYYRVYSGRAGRMIMEIDGKRVIYGEEHISYAPDQTCVRGFLHKGNHRIVLYLSGDVQDNLSFSIGIVRDPSRKVTAVDMVWEEVKDSFGSNFIGGFITYRKGLSGVRNSVKERMEKISHEDILHPYACHYSAKAESDDANKWKILDEGTSRLVDPFTALFSIQMEMSRYGMNGVYELCRKMDMEYPQSVFTDMCNLELSIQSGWIEEASKRIDAVEKKGFPLLADQFRIRIASECGGIASPFMSFMNLYRSAIDGKTVLRGLSDEFQKGYKTNQWFDLLERVISRDGYGIFHTLLAAEYHIDRNNYDAAIPLLSSVLKNAPENSDALYDFGRVYFGLGKNDVAKYYFDKAYESDPQNVKFRLMRKMISKPEPVDEEVPDKTLIDEGRQNRNNAVVCLEKKMSIEIRQTGEFEKRVREFYLINDAGKASGIAKRAVIIDETLESLDDIRYYVIHSGKMKESRHLERSSLSDDDGGIYSDLVQYEIASPGYISGDILVFEYSVRSVGTAEKGCYDERIILGGEYKTLVSELTLKDRSGTLNWKAYNCRPEISIEKKNGNNREVNLILKNIECIPDEKAMIPIESIIPEIRISSFRSYDELYTWFNFRIREREGLSGEVTRIIDKLTENITDRKTKASVIYKYFTDKIRYIGYENNRGGYIPRKAGETFKSGAGDCKDTAFLVTQAMKYAGIDAEMVLLMTNNAGKTDRFFPSLSAFNHAICRITIDKPLYLDCTVNGRELDELPEEDRDVDAFVISESKGYFEKIKGEDYIQRKERIYTQALILTNGTIAAERKIEKNGYPADLDNQDDSREDDVHAFWNERYPGVTVSDFAGERRQRTEITRYRIGIDNYAYVSDDEIVFPAHIIKSALPSYAKYPSRRTDLRISGDQEIESVMRFSVPEGFRTASIPANKEISFSGVRYRTEYSRDQDCVIVSTFIRIRPFQVSVREYAEFRKAMRIISDDQNTVISLIKGDK